MAALDDYAPLPPWFVVCSVLDKHPAGLSVGRVHVEVIALTGGRVSRWATVVDTLARMREDGIAEDVWKRRGRQRSRVHTLTEQGRELFYEARAEVARWLQLEVKRGEKEG